MMDAGGAVGHALQDTYAAVISASAAAQMNARQLIQKLAAEQLPASYVEIMIQTHA